METIIIHPDTKEKATAVKVFLKELKIPFEEIPNYDTAFVEKTNRSEEDFKAGRYKEIEIKDLWR